MRTLSILLAIASLATFPAAWAHHPDHDYDAGGGPYVGLETAANFLSDQGIHENGEEPGNLHFETGFLIGLVGGYALDNGLRPELEFSHRRNKIDGTEPATAPGTVTGFENNDSVFGNLWYDVAIPHMWRLHPYVGGGIGGSRVDARITGAAAGNGTFDTVFAWQGGAGVGYDVMPHMRLSLDWRYIHTNRANIERPGFLLPDGGDANYIANSLGVSMRWCFGGPRREHEHAESIHTSMRTEHARRAATLQTVNFQFDSADLTPAARDTLDDAARALRDDPSLHLRVEGATDAIGSASYNKSLSQRRAKAVRDYLVGRGVAANQLSTVGIGESKPVASNTSPEGRAENRRAEFETTSEGDLRIRIQGPSEESKRQAEKPAPGKKPDPGERRR